MYYDISNSENAEHDSATMMLNTLIEKLNTDQEHMTRLINAIDSLQSNPENRATNHLTTLTEIYNQIQAYSQELYLETGMPVSDASNKICRLICEENLTDDNLSLIENTLASLRKYRSKLRLAGKSFEVEMSFYNGRIYFVIKLGLQQLKEMSPDNITVYTSSLYNMLQNSEESARDRIVYRAPLLRYSMTYSLDYAQFNNSTNTEMPYIPEVEHAYIRKNIGIDYSDQLIEYFRLHPFIVSNILYNKNLSTKQKIEKINKVNETVYNNIRNILNYRLDLIEFIIKSNAYFKYINMESNFDIIQERARFSELLEMLCVYTVLSNRGVIEQYIKETSKNNKLKQNKFESNISDIWIVMYRKLNSSGTTAMYKATTETLDKAEPLQLIKELYTLMLSESPINSISCTSISASDTKINLNIHYVELISKLNKVLNL
jgi:hypothetical protein